MLISRFHILLLGLLSVTLVSCSGGSSGGSSAPSGTTFVQLTPSGGVNANDILLAKQPSTALDFTDDALYTKLTVVESTVYAGTSDGKILKMVTSNQGWIWVTDESIGPVIAISDNNSDGVYYAPYPSDQAFSTTGEGFTNGLDEGNISAITSSNNGSIYFGTTDGNVGLTNNPASKTIDTIPSPEFGPIISIGCSSNSCNSGQQGLLTLQAESYFAPTFESSTYATESEQYTYPTKLYYLLNQGHWTQAGYSNTISTSNSVTVESTTYTNVPEFITTITVNPDTQTAYAGTNFFNIYTAPLNNCNPGLGCDVIWNPTPLNAVPLGTVTNGTVGITSIAVTPNGTIYVVANDSESVLNFYQSQN